MVFEAEHEGLEVDVENLGGHIFRVFMRTSALLKVIWSSPNVSTTTFTVLFVL